LNPHFDAAARAGAARADILFGAGEEGDPDGAEAAGPLGGTRAYVMPIQEFALVAYGLLRDFRDPLLKDGRLASRLRRKLAALCPGDPGAAGIVEAIINALLAAGIASRDDDGVAVNFRAFAELLYAHREDLAFALAGMLSRRPGKARSLAAAEACKPFLDRRFAFSHAGLRRFIQLLSGEAPGETSGGVSGEAAGSKSGANSQAISPASLPDVEAYAEAMERLGLVEREKEAFRCRPERAVCPWRASSQETCASVDGSGAIHILPSASLREIVELLDGFTGNHLVLEFVDRDDPLVAEEPSFFRAYSADPSQFAGYTKEAMEAELKRCFHKVEMRPSHPGTRTMMVCTK